MASAIHRRKTCRLCDGTNLELVYQLAPSPIGDDYVSTDRVSEVQPTYPIDLFLCHECGMAQLLDVIAPEILYPQYIYVTASSLGLGEHFREYADEVLQRIGPPAGSLAVDLGSNDGTLLRCFQERGLRVLGIDPAQDIARAATASGIETLPRFFSPDLARQVRRERGGAAIVTANNVFANIDDLASFTAGVRDLLAPDGVFVFESFYLADVIENMVFDFIYHEHLSAFSVKPLQSFFGRMGMELIDVKRVATKGGSLRCTVQLAGGPRPAGPSVASMLKREREMGLHGAPIFRQFTARIEALKNRTRELLNDLKSKGSSIAGFGASITVTTLIYHFGIGSFFEYLVDDNPAKQGRFSPGLHLPVLPASVLYQRKPDYAVLLAWRYAAPIVQKHQAFLARGGRFIVPVPEVKVIGARQV